MIELYEESLFTVIYNSSYQSKTSAFSKAIETTFNFSFFAFLKSDLFVCERVGSKCSQVWWYVERSDYRERITNMKFRKIF